MMMALRYNGFPQFLFQGSETGGGATSSSSSGSPAPSSPSPSPGPGTETPTTTTPTSTAPISDSPGAVEDAFDFSTFFDGPSEGPTPQPATPTQAKPAEAPPAQPPVQQPVQPAPQTPVAEPQPPAQPQATQPPTQQPVEGPSVPAQLDRFDPAQLAHAMAANEAALTDAVASHVFNLSPKEVEALETNVVEAIPRLMARVLMQAQKSALTQMANILPVMMQRHNDTARGAEVNEGEFWKAWPALNPTAHRELVWRFASVFRRTYPQATLQELVANVGPMVMMMAKVNPAVGAGYAASAPGRAPTAQGNGRSPPPSPFVPAAGSGPANVGQVEGLNEWESQFADHG